MGFKDIYGVGLDCDLDYEEYLRDCRKDAEYLCNHPALSRAIHSLSLLQSDLTRNESNIKYCVKDADLYLNAIEYELVYGKYLTIKGIQGSLKGSAEVYPEDKAIILILDLSMLIKDKKSDKEILDKIKEIRDVLYSIKEV